jgi:signal peptidase I
MTEDNNNALNEIDVSTTSAVSPVLPSVMSSGSSQTEVELPPPIEVDLTTPRAVSSVLPPVILPGPSETGVAIPPAIEKAESSPLWQEIKGFTRDLVVAVLIAVLVIVFVVQPVRVEGTSMLPRLHDGERIFVNKFVYMFDRIERGDIVVFWYPNDPDKSFIKRVIGLPGETVSIRDGIVYVNGEPLDEPYLDSTFHVQRDSLSPTYVKPHYYFVMGDNRDASNDSRQWGLVPEKYIYGKAIFRYWPLSGVGTLN